MRPMRSDATRSRERILAAARAVPVRELRLNELARDAGVGVGTVYRHFPTVTALLEALHRDSLAELVELARQAARSPAPDSAFPDLVRRGARLQIAHDGLQTVLTAHDASDEVRLLREDLHRFAAEALDAAIAAGVIREELTIASVLRLVCGIEHAIRLGDEDEDEDELMMDVLIAGLRPPRA